VILPRSSSLTDDPDTAGAEAERFGFSADLNAAFTGSLIGRDDVTRHVRIIVGTYDFPTPFVFGAMPGFELHCVIPVMVHARFVSVASGVAGAITVSTSPALNRVAEFIVNVAAAAEGAKTIVPTLAPFFWMLNVVVAVAAVEAVPRLPESPTGKVTGAANT
jgi:hypothetical protein